MRSPTAILRSTSIQRQPPQSRGGYCQIGLCLPTISVSQISDMHPAIILATIIAILGHAYTTIATMSNEHSSHCRLRKTDYRRPASPSSIASHSSEHHLSELKAVELSSPAFRFLKMPGSLAPGWKAAEESFLRGCISYQNTESSSILSRCQPARKIAVATMTMVEQFASTTCTQMRARTWRCKESEQPVVSRFHPSSSGSCIYRQKTKWKVICARPSGTRHRCMWKRGRETEYD